MTLQYAELRELRAMPGGERMRTICRCGHSFYYHRINSGAGECFCTVTVARYWSASCDCTAAVKSGRAA